MYYSFRNPKTGKLTRQTNIKGGANQYKDKRSRYHVLKKLQESLTFVLAKGFNQHQGNSEFEDKLLSNVASPTLEPYFY